MRRYALGVVLGLALVGCGEKADTNQATKAASSVNAAALAGVQAWLKDHISPLTTLDANTASDRQDLAAFGDAVGNARVVVLNEDSYADSNAFELMNRLVQYLHQDKGFDVLLIESAMFDVEAIWRSAVDKNASATDLAPGRVFYMYSQTDASRKALQYIDSVRTSERPLQLVGLDIPLAGTTSINELLPALEQYLKQKGSNLPADAAWADYLTVAKKAISLNSAGSDLTQFSKMSAQLETELCQDKVTATVMRESASWWCRQVRGISTNVIRQQHQDDKNYDYRDTAMADNVSWLLENPLQGKKVIVWANASHGIPAVSGVNPETKKEIHTLGWHLQKQLGPQLYNVKISPLGGQVSRYWDTGEQPVQIDPASLEGQLKQLGQKQGFINAPTDAAILAQFDQIKKPYAFGKDVNGLFFYDAAFAAHQGSHPILPLP
ncbi:erythromycin esterase family protein [Chitinibacter bivalviorum]|uniref:Erythromycin esterase family protein n=1 Tax=Chitinibacter bivalviorum TaxID=2739434 RepID=A0A7H9BJI1_9NEIS|nr:erythromycin esterase family protein [Chitinibacter bivalviorum]QLG88532.1 erythromycin esterase family protein [Chitinibacter bivalviorum]